MIKTRAKRFLQKSPLRNLVVKARHRDIGINDVWLASYPKSGNTWVRSMIATGLSGDRPSRDDIGRIIPYVGFHKNCKFRTASGGRIIKTHERFLPIYHKSVYIVRDWREVCVSYFYFEKRHDRFSGSLPEFVEMFQHGTVDGYGSWADNVSRWLSAARKDEPNILIVRYEDIVKNPLHEIQKIFEYLGLVSKLNFEEIIRLNSFENMKSDEKASMAKNYLFPFARGGYLGGNMDEFNEVVEDIVISEEFERINRLLGYE